MKREGESINEAVLGEFHSQVTMETVHSGGSMVRYNEHNFPVLLCAGADPYIPNLSGILPVDFAGSSGNFEAAKLLENHMKQARPHD